MHNLATLIGIDDYPNSPLNGCSADAEEIARRLSHHHDGAPNINCKVLTAPVGGGPPTCNRSHVLSAMSELFSKTGLDVALFFFAGHGFHGTNGGHIFCQDSSATDPGIPMAELISAANNSTAAERIIILDCCHAGAIQDLFASNTQIALKPGVSILAACRDNEFAEERDGRGYFSQFVCDALDGGAADVTGAVTAASIYAYVDEVLTGWDQRPLFISNISNLKPLRHAEPAIAHATLRKLSDYFPAEDYELPLDPSHEPEEEPQHEENQKKFGVLQKFRSARLVEPVGTEHMYYAAMESKGCRLTPLGQYYWRRVKAGKI